MAQDLGLLLGVREDGGGYRTYWLARQGVSVSIFRMPGALWVRRGEQFAEVGVVRSTKGNWTEDSLIMIPVGTDVMRAEPKPPLGEDTAGSLTREITFLNSSMIGMDVRLEAASESSRSSRHSASLQTVGLDWEFPPIPFASVFGSEKAKFDQQVQQFLGTLSAADRNRLQERPGPDSWALRHRQGRWLVVSRLAAAQPSDRGFFADMTAELTIPEIVQKSPTVPDWNNVKSTQADTRDFVTALDGSFVAVLAPQSVLAYGARNGRLSRQMGFAAGQPSSIVMTEWVRGDGVRQVNQQVRALRSQMPK